MAARYNLRQTEQRKRMQNQQHLDEPKAKRRCIAKMKLVDLIDDCLVQIFLFLDIADLSNVCEASASFKKAARDAFEQICRRNVIKVSTKCDIETKSIPSVVQLKRFGDLIRKLEVTYVFRNERFDAALENAIDTYCHKSLTEITLNGMGYFGFDDNTEPFERVSKVVINRGLGAGIVRRLNTMFPNAQSLDFEQTEIYEFDDTRSIAQHFPSLTHLGLSCEDPDLEFSVDDLEDAINANPQLQSLKLKDTHSIGIDAALLHHVKNRLPQLQSLSLDFSEIFPDDMDDLATDESLNFENLTHLSMAINDGLRFPRIYGDRLETLSLEKDYLPSDSLEGSNDAIQYVSLNRNLHKLELLGYWGRDFPVEELVKKLPNLIELSVQLLGFDKVMWILQHSNNLKKFSVKKIGIGSVAQIKSKFDGNKKTKSEWTMSIKYCDGVCAVFDKK